MRLLTLFIILASLSLNCYSQVPGYMGHRFSIEGDVNLLPWFTNTLKHNRSRFVPQKYKYNYSEPGFLMMIFILMLNINTKERIITLLEPLLTRI